MQTIRERIRRKRRRKRLRLLAVCLFLAASGYLLRSAWIYIHGPDFAFGTISIKGTKQLVDEDIIRMGGGKAPLNLFNISIGRIREGLRQDYRFQNTQVTYRWPAEISITAEEREAALYVANSYHSYLKLDYSGVVLAVTAGIPDANAPILVGVNCGNIYLGDMVTEQEVLNILIFLRKISPEARAAIAEITADGDNRVKLGLRGSFPVILGNINDVPHKAELFMTVFEETRSKKIQAEYIDLTFAKPYIKVSVRGNQ